MRRLIALAVPGGPAFVDALRRCWDDGDAVVPLDQRLPPPAQRRLLDALAPAEVRDHTGSHPRSGAVPVEPGDALVMATSGTTGEPKGVVLTHDAVAASARITSAALGVDPDRDRWVACLPLAHVGGLSVVTRALLTATPVEVHPGVDPAALAAAVGRGATLVSLVPAALTKVPTEGFRVVLLGGSAIPATRPANTVATYGLTETGSGVVYDGWPLPGVEVRVRAGEVQLRSPTLLRCYRDGTDPRLPDGWFPTGDAGELDPEGRLVIHGRRGDVIVTGGQKVWPAAVEPVLAIHPGVAAVAVVGRPHSRWGHVVTAVVVPRDPAAPPTLGELRDHVRAELAAFMAPQRLEIVDSLPTTALGKTRRDSL